MISGCPDYFLATNAAYEVLKLYNGNYPQIDIWYILYCFRKNISVHSYSEVAKRMGISTDDFVNKLAESEMGYTVCDIKRKHWIIYYNDTKAETTIRYTLAHELGHVLSGHTYDCDINDKEANCFARNLLCPVPLRNEFNLTTPDEYCDIFNISDAMAKVVISLNSSDKYYITKDNYDNLNNKMCFTGQTLAERYGY